MSAPEQASWAWRNPPEPAPLLKPEVDQRLAAKVLRNEYARNPRSGEDPLGVGRMVEVFDQHHGFWRVGTVITAPHGKVRVPWVRVRTPGGVFKVAKAPELVRPIGA